MKGAAMKYLCAALGVLLVLVLVAFCFTNDALTDARHDLAVAHAVNAENAKSVEAMNRSVSISERAITGWDEDRVTIAQLRATTRQSIREAMKDEMFKIWATGAVPADGWRMLHKSTGKDGSYPKDAPRSPDAGVPGNSNSPKRQ